LIYFIFKDGHDFNYQANGRALIYPFVAR